MSCNGKPETTTQIRRVVAEILYAREAREKAEDAFGESAKRLSKANDAYDDAIKAAAEMIGPSMRHDEILVTPMNPRFGLAKRGDNSIRLVPLLGVSDLAKPHRIYAVPTSRAQGNPTLAVQPLQAVEVEGVMVPAPDPDRHRPVFDPREACGSKTVVDLG